MKNKIMLLAAVAMLWSCKKSIDLTPESTENSLPHKSGAVIASAGDGAWDLLGYGYDVTDQFDNSQSSRYAVIDINAYKQDYPTYVESFGSETGYWIFHNGSDVADFSSKLTSTAKLDVFGADLFKGTIDNNFSQENKWSSKYIYASISSHVIKKTVKMVPDASLLMNYLHAGFVNHVQTKTPAELVQLYGTHILANIKLGGKLELLYQAETSSYDRTTAAGAGASASFTKIFAINTGTSYSSTAHQFNSNEKSFIRTIGGNASQSIIQTVTINASGNPSATFNISGWQAGITDTNAELIEIDGTSGLIPLYDLIADPVKKSDVQAYVLQYILDHQVIMTPNWDQYNGQFFHDNSTGRVLICMEGKLRHIETVQTLNGLFSYNPGMLNYRADLSNLPPVGISIKPDNGLINDRSTGKLYLREGSVLRHIVSQTIKNLYHFSGNITNINTVAGYAIGTPLSY